MIKSNKGFTLIELLVVIAIIGLLSTLAVVSLNNARSKARDARRTADLKTIQSALELSKGDNSNSAIFAMPAAGPGAWASLGTSASFLANYLPGGMPVDPSGTPSKYNLCTNNTAGGPMNYLLTATLENTTSVPGGSVGLISAWAAGDCRDSLDSNPSTVAAGTCQTAGLFCLGDISK